MAAASIFFVNSPLLIRVGDAYVLHGCPSCPQPADGGELEAGSATVFYSTVPWRRKGNAAIGSLGQELIVDVPNPDQARSCGNLKRDWLRRGLFLQGAVREPVRARPSSLVGDQRLPCGAVCILQRLVAFEPLKSVVV